MTPGGPHPGEQGAAQDQSSDLDAARRIFDGSTEDDRARIRVDLLRRAVQVRANGWEPYRGLWSSGEVIGVAALLGDHCELIGLGETVRTAWERWAFDLWGLDRGHADVDNGCVSTRQWFLDAAYELAGLESVRERSEGPSGEDIPMSEQLAAHTGHDIDFEPDGLDQVDPTARRLRASYSDCRDDAE